ncbi:MAG: hypothetical protein IT239_06975 [Bacteroidia bacterium]|nr:hypothetical protein [Bacteroidia bacterium]
MKHFLLLLMASTAYTVNAQVVISKVDMPVPADTIYYTIHAGSLPLQPTTTGANYTWDYSSLSGTNQQLDSFIAVTNAPFFSIATFNNPLDPLHKATVALKTTPPQFGSSYAPISFKDFYTFYRNKTTEYAGVGVAATISLNNGTPTNAPAKYSALDIIYKFPLTYDEHDSSLSLYKFDLGTTGYFSEKRFRRNHVDGYGQLITPYGTFETMRVKSYSEIEDTIYFSSFPLKFKRYETVYSWLAPGFHEPMLRITYNSISQTNQGAPTTEYFDINRLANAIKNQMIESSLIKKSLNRLTFDASLRGKDIYVFNINGQLLQHQKIEKELVFTPVTSQVVVYYIPEYNIKGKIGLEERY